MQTYASKSRLTKLEDCPDRFSNFIARKSSSETSKYQISLLFLLVTGLIGLLLFLLMM